MDMVDGALKRPDVALSKRGTFGLSSIRLRAVRSDFLTQIPGAGPVKKIFSEVRLSWSN